jgi:hypothetical protein
MNGQRRYWRPGKWAKGRLVTDVDVPDALIQGDFDKIRRPVRWAEAEQLSSMDTMRGSVELWEVRHQRWGWKAPVVRSYVVDASVWLPVNDHRAAAFWQTTSFWRRADAVLHVDQLQLALSRLG